MSKNILSIITPFYNEANVLPYFISQMNEFLNSFREINIELIFVDDGSEDGTFEQLGKIKFDYPNIKIKLVKLSRNFGSHAALLAGMSICRGDIITVLYADLQDPPRIIPELLEKFNQGNDIVLGVRKNLGRLSSSGFFSSFYYFLIKEYALPNMPLTGFDIFMINRRIRNILLKISEKNSSLFGQLAWLGYKVGIIYYDKQPREQGNSKWSLAKKIKLFADSFIAFSPLPIRILQISGLCLASLGFLYAFYIVRNYFIHGTSIAGWSSVMVVLLFVSGFQIVMFGIVGEYLMRILDEARRRPIYIIDKVIDSQ